MNWITVSDDGNDASVLLDGALMNYHGAKVEPNEKFIALVTHGAERWSLVQARSVNDGDVMIPLSLRPIVSEAVRRFEERSKA